MSIYPMEKQQAKRFYLYNEGTVNEVKIAEGQRLFIDGSPAVIIRAWRDGIQIEALVAVCVKPYNHVPAWDLAEKMLETALCLDSETPSYRDVKVRIENRTDDFDVLGYSDSLAKKYEDS